MWHQKFATGDVTAVFVNINMGQRRGQDLTKSLYLKGYTAKRLTDEFPEKRWTTTKCDVNKNRLLKQLRDAGTVDRRPELPNAHTTQQPALFRATHILSKKNMPSYAYIFQLLC